MWEDQLLKENAELTVPMVDVETADGDDKCCEMIKGKFMGEMTIISPATGTNIGPQDISCETLQANLERISILEKERGKKYRFDPNDMNKFFATHLLKEWDECAKSSESWVNLLR